MSRSTSKQQAGPGDDIRDVEAVAGELVHYLRESDGTVQSVNEGSIAHAALERDPEFEETTRAKAEAAAKGARPPARTVKT